MPNAIFYHKPDSIYDDRPEQFYHFPAQYLSRVEQSVGDYAVYYGPIGGDRCYWAVCRVKGVRTDPNRADHYYADVSDYLDFDRAVPYRENGGFERQLVEANGRVNPGRAIQAVRLIERDEFAAIVEAGLSRQPAWPERYDQSKDVEQSDGGFADHGQSPYADRPIVQQLLNRKFRDRKFRDQVRAAYDRTCAFSGLRLLNGKGRPEVEAAHIVPVEANGPDAVQNGIALSGTIHWMFDRGMLSLSDDFTILVSRQLNHDVSAMLHRDMRARVPSESRLQPQPRFLHWHRENRFKT